MSDRPPASEPPAADDGLPEPDRWTEPLPLEEPAPGLAADFVTSPPVGRCAGVG